MSDGVRADGNSAELLTVEIFRRQWRMGLQVLWLAAPRFSPVALSG
jgi:hypothetical protein